MPRIRSFCCLLLLVIPFALEAGQPVRDLILHDVGWRQQTGGRATLRIGFNLPVFHLRHWPASKGDSVRIVVEIKPGKDVPEEYLRRRESLRIPERLAAIVDDIRYEGDRPGHPWVVVDFHRPVRYDVRPGRDGRSLEIDVDDGE